MKKALKILSRFFLTILVILIVGTAVLAVRHQIKTRKDLALVEGAYGEFYTLSTGEKVNYTFYDSSSDEVAVILPGFGCSSVHYDFDALAKGISDKYKIIIFEPLGYGLSDSTTRERTAVNYCLELHELICHLGYNRYTLIGHSISGVYALKYTNMYPDEVKSFIGIDASVPRQVDVCDEATSPENMYKTYKILRPTLINTGIYRVITEMTFSSTLESIPTLTEDEQQKDLAMNCTNQLNDTQMDEVKDMAENFDNCYDLKFPENIPVLYMLADSNCEEIPKWDDIHDEVITNPEGKVVILSGNHYLYLSNLDGVVQNIMDW